MEYSVVPEGMMINVQVETPVMILEERLRRGAQLLFELEQRGEVRGQYNQWLTAWTELLERYEALQAA